MAGKSWLGWLLVLAGVLAAAPLVLGRGKPVRLRALDEISRMTDVERETLKRKYEQYRSLSEQQRTELRGLHQMLEEDRGSGGRSVAAMYAYCDWLKTIDPWQQDELAHITDPQQKAKRVAEIVKERQQRELDAETRQLGDRAPPMGELFTLSEEQLTQIFDVLSRRLTNLTEEEQKQIEQSKGLQRFGLQIRHLRKTVSNPEALFLSISDAEISEMAEASGNASLKSLLNSGPGDGQMRKRLAILAIFASCRNLIEAESAKTTDTELQTFFSSLPPEEQDQLLQLRADEFKTLLRLKRMESDPIVSELRYLMGRQFSTLMRRMERLRKQGGPPGPNGQGGPFNRPGAFEGDRPLPDRRREGGGFPRPFRGEPQGDDNGPPPGDRPQPPPADSPPREQPPE